MSSGSGAAKADETLLRGAALVDGPTLGAALKRGASEEDLAQVIEWGGVPIPYKTEPEHFLIEGRPARAKRKPSMKCCARCADAARRPSSRTLQAAIWHALARPVNSC
jgi:hypothetical protein